MDPFAIATSQLDQLIARLTPRQMQIVELLARGISNKATAALLSISTTGVKHHIWRMCRKVEVENRTQLIVIYVRWKETNGEQCDLHSETRE